MEEHLVLTCGEGSALFVLVHCVCVGAKHVTEIKPYGTIPGARRRAGTCLIGSEFIICGGTRQVHSRGIMYMCYMYISRNQHVVPSQTTMYCTSCLVLLVLCNDFSNLHYSPMSVDGKGEKWMLCDHDEMFIMSLCEFLCMYYMNG